MKYNWFLIILALFLTGCKGRNTETDTLNNNELIIVEGELKDGADQLVTLDLMEPEEFVPVAQTRCDGHGRFSFSFPGKGVNFYSLKFTEEGYITLIASEGDRIAVTGNASTVYPYEVKGSEATLLVKKLAEEHKRTLDQLETITAETINLPVDGDYSSKKIALNNRFDSIAEAFRNYSRNFILNNPESPAILIALYNQFGPELPVFHPLNDLDIYRFVDSTLYSNYPENRAVKSLHSQLSAALQQLRNQQFKSQLERGMTAPDFVLKTPEGENISLKELRGNYVLLQVWASWSKPSVEENRVLKECMERFKEKNFAIMQVSIDNDKAEWINAIEERYPQWYHVSDLNRWESTIVNLYRIERIPANFLIDPSGKIIEIDTFGDELIQVLKKELY